MKRHKKIAAAIVAAAEKASAAGFNAIVVRCSRGLYRQTSLALRSLPEHDGAPVIDDTISEHWEPSGPVGEIEPTWYVPVFPRVAGNFKSYWNLCEHRAPADALEIDDVI